MLRNWHEFYVAAGAWNFCHLCGLGDLHEHMSIRLPSEKIKHWCRTTVNKHNCCMKFGMNLTWHGFVEKIILEFLLQDHEHGHMQHGVPCVGGSTIPPWHQPKRYQQLLGQSMNGFLWRALPCRQILLCNAASWSNGSFGWDWGEIINYQLVIELLSCVGVRCVIVSFHWFFF